MTETILAGFDPLALDAAPVDFGAVLAELTGARLDLLVCGARGYGPLRAVLLGGVSRRVAVEARCPVIVLPRGERVRARRRRRARAAAPRRR